MSYWEKWEREKVPTLFTQICSSASYNLEKYKELKNKGSEDYISPEQMKKFKKQKKKICEVLDESDQKGLDMYRSFEPMSNWVSILQTQQEAFQQIEEEPQASTSGDFVMTFGNTANDLKYMQTELKRLIRDKVVGTKTPNEIRLENIYEDLKDEYERRAERLEQINESFAMAETKLKNAQSESEKLGNEYKRLDKTLNDLCDERGPEIVLSARKTRLLTIEWKSRKLEMLEQIDALKEDIDVFLNKGNKANKITRQIANIDEDILRIKKEYDTQINQIKEAISGTNSTHQSMMSILNKEQDKTRSTLLYKEKTLTNSEIKRIKSGSDRVIKKHKRQISQSLKQIEKNAKKAAVNDFENFLQFLKENAESHLEELKQITDEQIKELQEISKRHTDDINESINKRIENIFFMTESAVVEKETKKERLSTMLRDKTLELESITSQVVELESIISDVSRYLDYLEKTKGAPRIELDEKASEEERMKYESIIRCSELAEFNKRAKEIIQRINTPLQKITSGSVSDPIPKGITPFGSALGNFIEGLQVTLEEPMSNDSILFSGSTFVEEDNDDDKGQTNNISIFMPFIDENAEEDDNFGTSNEIAIIDDESPSVNIETRPNYSSEEENKVESYISIEEKSEERKEVIYSFLSKDNSIVARSMDDFTDEYIDKTNDYLMNTKNDLTNSDNNVLNADIDEHNDYNQNDKNRPYDNEEMEESIHPQNRSFDNIDDIKRSQANNEKDQTRSTNDILLYPTQNVSDEETAHQENDLNIPADKNASQTDENMPEYISNDQENLDDIPRPLYQQNTDIINVDGQYGEIGNAIETHKHSILSEDGVGTAEDDSMIGQYSTKRNSEGIENQNIHQNQLDNTKASLTQRISFDSVSSDEYAKSDSSLSSTSFTSSVKAPQNRSPMRSPRNIHSKKSMDSQSSKSSTSDVSLLDTEGLMELAGLHLDLLTKTKSPRRKNTNTLSKKSKKKKVELLKPKPKPQSPTSSSASFLSSGSLLPGYPNIVRSKEHQEFYDEEEVNRVRHEVAVRTRTLVKRNLGIASSSSDIPPPKRHRKKAKVKKVEKGPIAVASGIPKLSKTKPRTVEKEPTTAISIRRWYGGHV